jgi:hypothetical protein
MLDLTPQCSKLKEKGMELSGTFILLLFFSFLRMHAHMSRVSLPLLLLCSCDLKKRRGGYLSLFSSLTPSLPPSRAFLSKDRLIFVATEESSFHKRVIEEA